MGNMTDLLYIKRRDDDDSDGGEPPTKPGTPTPPKPEIKKKARLAGSFLLWGKVLS